MGDRGLGTGCLFSVVIPTVGRPRQLSRCLSAIARLHFPRDRFEVIVVNDGGDVAPEEGLATLAGNVSLQLLSQPNRGAAAARNAGSAVARGEFIAFIDDDCVVSETWLDNLSLATARFPDALIGGTTINLLAANLCSQASERLVEYVVRYYNQPGMSRTPFFASNNFTIRRESLARLGGFDETFRFAEDRDLCLRWHAQGGTFHHAPDVIVRHGHDLSVPTFVLQHFGYGRGALPYRDRAKGDGGLRLEPLAFYSRMLGHPFESGDSKAAVVSLLIVIAQVANAAGFAYEAGRRGLLRLSRRAALVDDAVLHHEAHLLRPMDVVERISRDRDNIGELPGLDGSHSFLPAEQLRSAHGSSGE